MYALLALARILGYLDFGKLDPVVWTLEHVIIHGDDDEDDDEDEVFDEDKGN